MAMDRAALRALILQKDEIEKQIMDLNDALSCDNMGGTSTPVIDAEGFPRADIDVHTTLTLRNRLVHLNNDHKAMMLRIEHGLTGVLPPSSSQLPTGAAAAPPARPAPARAAAPAWSAADAATGATQPPPAASTGPSPMEVIDVSDLSLSSGEILEGFAVIDEVAPNGPAAAAGVRVGDVLLKFGNVTARNHDGLRALGRLTQRSVGDSIGLIVKRLVLAPDAAPIDAASGGLAQPGAPASGAEEHLRLQLQPRRWAGNGLLGCHLQPL